MLKSLTLKNFRNYKKAELNFAETVTSLIGENASGKTNLLEAIALFGILKSFRGVGFEDLILEENESAHLSLAFSDKIFEIIWSKNPLKKTLKINSTKVSAAKFLSEFSVVIFTPDDLLVFTLEPERRRKFLDSLAVRLDLKIASRLAKYKKALKNRNAILAKNGADSELIFWEKIMAEENFFIWNFRENLVKKLNTICAQSQNFLPKKTHFEIKYSRPLFSDSPEKILEKLKQNRVKDALVGMTTFGIHRDDFSVDLNNKNLKTHGSRGEMRTAIFALKYAESLILEQEKNTRPILLLDDIFSELDLEREEILGKLIQNYQAIITSTVAPKIAEQKIYQIKNGEIF